MLRCVLVISSLLSLASTAWAFDEVVNPGKNIVPDHVLPRVDDMNKNNIEEIESEQSFVELKYEGTEIEPSEENLEKIYSLIEEGVSKIVIQSFGFAEDQRGPTARKLAMDRAMYIRSLLVDEGFESTNISVDLFFKPHDQINKVLLVVEQ